MTSTGCSNRDIRALYNQLVPGKFQGDYEFERWFRRPRSRSEYFMTYSSIRRQCEDVQFSRCLEIGPGPGTWTPVLFRSNPSAEFDLVDISEEMREQFFGGMRAGLENVRYHTGDFLDFQAERPYDFVLCSRALEYFEDKRAFATQLARLLASGAEGVMITKNPDRWLLRKLIGRKDRRSHHQGQVGIRKLRDLLEAAGFRNVKCFPAVIQLPVGRLLAPVATGLVEGFYARLCGRELSTAPRWVVGITESYLVRFSRP